MKKIYVFFISVFVLSCLIIGCIDEPIDPIYNPNDKGGPTPEIHSITPAGLAYAVTDEIIIRGQNFAPVPVDNFVYFNKTKVPVATASSTELRFMAPNMEGDSIEIKVAAMGAQLFSGVWNYKLLPTFIEMGDYGPVDAFFAIECDAAGNLYVNLQTGTTGRIDKIDREGNITQYATLGFGSANAMKFAPDGSLYCSRMSPLISKVPSGGGASTNLPSALIPQYNVYDLDFDKYGNMWVVGYHATVASRKIVKLKDDVVADEYPFNARFRAVKIFNDYLYVAGLDGSDADKAKIWRVAIDGNADLGEFELYYDWSANYSSSITTLTIAADGTLYVGNDGPDNETIVAITPNKVASPLYVGNLIRSTYNLVWGTGADLQYTYLSRRVAAAGGSANNKIIKMYMAKDGAPYLGR